MLISYVVRLRSDALADGRFVGEVEAVSSRQRRSIRDIDQLATFVLATMAVQVASKETARDVVFDTDMSCDGDSRAEDDPEPGRREVPLAELRALPGEGR